MKKFEVGAIVRLNSGSPKLIVTAVSEDGMVTTHWIVNGLDQSADFPAVCLTADA